MNKRYSLFRWWGYVLRYGWPNRIFYFWGGLGDQLLCTAVGHELQKRGAARGIWWFTDYAKVFRNSPELQPLIPKDDGLVRWAEKFGVPIVKLAYEEHDGDLIAKPPNEHYIAAICRKAGITGQIDLRPYWPKPDDTAYLHRARARIVTHSSVLNAKFPIPNKQWPVERMQQVVDLLSKEADVVQIGDPRDPELVGVADKRGCSLDEAAAILCSADVFLGMEGFLVHLARAVDCPSVIIHGGRHPAVLSGYSCNTNLQKSLPCSPCWLNYKCDFQRQCLTDISVGEVLAEVRHFLAAPPSRPISPEKFSLS